MALERMKLTRVFKLTRNGKTTALEDPGENLSPSQVMDFYSNTYPELINCRLDGPKFDNEGNQVFEFRTTLGTKG